MTSIKKIMAVAAFAGAATLAMSGTASAYVVCNGAGDCWHSDARYRYDPALHVQIHPDDWYFHHDWAHDDRMHWRDYHEGRGYYRNGVWVNF